MSWAGARGRLGGRPGLYPVYRWQDPGQRVDGPAGGREEKGGKPRWIGYVGVDDVDAAADRVKRLGGAVHVPPTDVPNISRFSVFADPQMATLALLKWLRPGQEQPAELGAPGRVGWHELLAADWEKALAFYGELFGWQKADADIGAMGTYQLFSAGGQTIGGMFTKPPRCRSRSGSTISTSATSTRRRSA